MPPPVFSDYSREGHFRWNNFGFEYFYYRDYFVINSEMNVYSVGFVIMTLVSNISS